LHAEVHDALRQLRARGHLRYTDFNGQFCIHRRICPRIADNFKRGKLEKPCRSRPMFDLRGRVPISSGQGPNLENYDLGQAGGSESVLLTVAQLPSHTHVLNVHNGRSNQTNPAGNRLARGFGVYEQARKRCCRRFRNWGSRFGSAPRE
jgi:hypothetical protein